MRWDLINYLISENSYSDYLEIGVQDYYSCCAKIQAQNKTTVDPYPRNLCDYAMFSDQFFSHIKSNGIGKVYDIIFIDGLHHDDQVYRDIMNSLDHLRNGGTIVVHDCLPHTEHMQLRDDHGGEWTGDVWKAIVKIKSETDDLTINTVDHDYGCCIIQRGSSKRIDLKEQDLNWQNYLSNRSYWLGVITENEFYELYKQS